MSITMQVDTAIEVFVNAVQLIDDNDYKTIEEAIAYNQAGLDLNWNFITTTGTVTQTNVTPTTGGDYDWAHVGNGMYKIEIPAAGGVSINNNAEGTGWFSGVCTGVLPWVSPQYTFVPANISNSLVNGTDNLEVDTVAISGDTTAADNAELDYDGTGYNKANSQVGTVATLTGHTPQTGDNFARLGAPAGASVSADIANIPTVAEFNARTLPTADYFDPAVDTVANVTTTANLTTNNDKTGYALSAAGVQAIWDALTAALTTVGSIGKLLVDNVNATISSRSSHTANDVTGGTTVATAESNIRGADSDDLKAISDQIDNVPTVAEMNARTLVAADYFDPAVDAVANVTLVATTTNVTNAVSVDAIDAATANTIADHTWRRTWANIEASADGDAITFRSGLGMMAKLVNRIRSNAGTLTIYRDDDATPLGTQTLTTDAAADPIVEADTT